MKKIIYLSVFLIGFFVLYLLWPRAIELPYIGSVKEWQLAEVSGNEAAFQDRPKLVTFIYTQCPDVCPTTMLDLIDLKQIMDERGISQEKYYIIAVTVDPEYDTNEILQQYKEMFDIHEKNWLFFRGTDEQTYQFSRYFNFFYEKNEDGFLTHTTSMYIVDSKNQIRAHHDMATVDKRVAIEEIADHLQQLIK
ncbi:SCO family protein [Sporosarcina sp. ZBG7A]|uniref:SCO family protein n=1 Tax=Sporosarcina sp. ZBG7A TaxID=1582223 RepID=UPI00057AC74C|nr:SCO family protein [Sporosarcina sp. ZBG7A]